MKGIFLVIIIFLVCALVGYQVAIRFDQSANVNYQVDAVASIGDTGPQQKEYKVILIHVDRLDRPQPRMISLWFISLFFVEGNPPFVTFAQMYPTPANAGIHQSLERAFSLNPQGEPSTGFWKVVKTIDIEWDGYLLVDDFAVQTVMEWTNGAGDFPGIIGATQIHPEESKRVLMETCQAVGGIANRKPAPFAFTDLFPAHFRSNLLMADAVAYWNELTTANLPVGCDVLLAP